MIAQPLPPKPVGRKLFTLGRKLFLISLFGIKSVPVFLTHGLSLYRRRLSILTILVTISLKTYGILPPKAATVCSGQRPQHSSVPWGAYSRPEAAIVSCGQRPQGFISQKSRLKSGHIVTLQLHCNY